VSIFFRECSAEPQRRMGATLTNIASFESLDVFLVPNWKALYPSRLRASPRPSQGIVFDLCEESLARHDDRYTNVSQDLSVGQSSTPWSAGILHVAVRVLTPNGLRRLGLCHQLMVSVEREFSGVPPLTEIPIRVLFPGAFQVNGKEYPIPRDLPAGTLVRLTVDFDAMVIQLRIGDWDSAVIDMAPPALPLPLYPYVLLDAGDAFEVLRPKECPVPALAPSPC